MRIFAIIVAVIGVLACIIAAIVSLNEPYQGHAIAEIGAAIASVGIIFGAFVLGRLSK
jgi:hypothetical protein